MVTIADAVGVFIVTGCKKRSTSFGLVASSVILYGNWPKTAGVCLVLWCPIRACMAPIGSKFGSKTGVHPLGWTDGEGENRLTEPGFRGESPWPSTEASRGTWTPRYYPKA
jgi:hypothetical protein